MRTFAFGKEARREAPRNAPRSQAISVEALPPREPRTAPSPQELFLANLVLIERLVTWQCRRYHIRREAAEDFASWVKLKLIDDGYKVFRQYKGKSKLETYLTVVVQRLALDHLDHLWGKWRPSAEARRLGPLAVRIERLRRDGISREEILRTSLGSEVSTAEVETILARLPQRVPRRMAGEGRLATLQAPGGSPEQHLCKRESEEALARVRAVLERALAGLPPEDRALARLRGRLKVADIARLFGREEKPLYRRMEKILRVLRRAMEREGVSAEVAREALADPVS
jgi:RNA polymerase sigma factor (sigma-70 family)